MLCLECVAQDMRCQCLTGQVADEPKPIRWRFTALPALFSCKTRDSFILFIEFLIR